MPGVDGHRREALVGEPPDEPAGGGLRPTTSHPRIRQKNLPHTGRRGCLGPPCWPAFHHRGPGRRQDTRSAGRAGRDPTFRVGISYRVDWPQSGPIRWARWASCRPASPREQCPHSRLRQNDAAAGPPAEHPASGSARGPGSSNLLGAFLTRQRVACTKSGKSSPGRTGLHAHDFRVILSIVVPYREPSVRL